MSAGTSPSPVSESGGLFARARAIQRQSRKPDDFLWARYASRPVAALLLAALERAPLTPNGVSLASLACGLLGCAAFAFWPGPGGLWTGWALLQLAYVVDCMDGMLARSRGLHSAAGTALDFLADAIKQTFLFPAVAFRLWQAAGQPLGALDGWALWCAILSGPLVASALAMTVFLRSPEVTGGELRALRESHDRSPTGRLLALLAFLLNYPSWLLLPVLFDRLDLFLAVSLPLYAAHGGWSLWRIGRRLCRRDHYRAHDGDD